MISTRPRPKSQPTSMHSRRRRRFSPLLLVGLSVPIVLGLIAGAVFILPRLGSHAAAAANPNCTLIVPANPLSAQGLATPYQLFAPDAAANGQCNEANPAQGTFVQGDIIDPSTGQISIYNPLVIDKGTTPLVAPVAPTLPRDAVVVLWLGLVC